MPLSAAAQTQVDAFNTSLTPDQRTNFASALSHSPALVDQINAAVASGDLNGFSLLPAGTHAGGQYNPTARTMEIPASIISTPAGGRYNAGELTFVMGHEIQHAINRPTQAAADATLATEGNRIGQSASLHHDYTGVIATRLAANRVDEASAHLAGYNATVSMVRANGNANPSLEDIYRANPSRMQDFIAVTPGTPSSTYALRPGLTANADMSLPVNAANTEAMGRHFFDKPASASRLGANGDSNYQNYYATNLVSFAVQVERANAPTHAAAGRSPQLELNMSTLGISEAQIERNGLNLGAAGGRQPYVDIGTTPPTPGNLDHTATTHRHVPITVPDVQAPPAPVRAPEGDHPAVRHAMDALDRSPNIPADAFGADRQRVAAGVAAHAAAQGITPDHVVFNDRRTDLIAVQGSLSDPSAKIATPLPVNDALRTDLQQAMAKIDAPQPNGQTQTFAPPAQDAAQQDAKPRLQ
ncbi:MAG: XVIPCD domain-containing protein [Lysobacteraceae bacterium]